ncbi:hypothetical protein Tco_0692987 [Tanacetum coccineum]
MMRDSSDKPFSPLRLETWKSILDITKPQELYMYALTNPFKDFCEWSNVSGIKLSSFSESKDTFTSLQVLTNLYDLFSGFMNYFWSPPSLEEKHHIKRQSRSFPSGNAKIGASQSFCLRSWKADSLGDVQFLTASILAGST